MSNREDYQTHMEEQLTRWTAQLDARKASPDLKPETKKELDEWSAKGAHAFAKLAELKATTGDAWDVRKGEMETTWWGIHTALAPDAVPAAPAATPVSAAAAVLAAVPPPKAQA